MLLIIRRCLVLFEIIELDVELICSLVAVTLGNTSVVTRPGTFLNLM